MVGLKSQLDEIEEVARELETDDDPERFEGGAEELVKQEKPEW